MVDAGQIFFQLRHFLGGETARNAGVYRVAGLTHDALHFVEFFGQSDDAAASITLRNRTGDKTFLLQPMDKADYSRMLELEMLTDVLHRGFLLAALGQIFQQIALRTGQSEWAQRCIGMCNEQNVNHLKKIAGKNRTVQVKTPFISK